MCSVLRYSPPLPSENMAEVGKPLADVGLVGAQTLPLSRRI